jgi:hypothetical protein
MAAGSGGPSGNVDFVHDPGRALHEDLWPNTRAIGVVSVTQREWAAKNSRVTFKTRSRSMTC